MTNDLSETYYETHIVKVNNRGGRGGRGRGGRGRGGYQ